jgi:hypothetical protein
MPPPAKLSDARALDEKYSSQSSPPRPKKQKSRRAQRMDLRERGCNAVRRKSAAKKASGRKAMFRTAFARSLAIALAAILAAPLVCAQIAWAQDPPPVRIRGTVERIDGATSVVKARGGVELKVTVADNAQIAGVIKASLSDIKQNSFVGVTAMPQPDDSLNAVEVHIFPESMRGTGEGHYPWDLQPQSTMTNANVEQVEIQGRRKENHSPRQRTDRDLRAGRQDRHQAGREGLRRCREAGRRIAARPRLADRPRQHHAANVILLNNLDVSIEAGGNAGLFKSDQRPLMPGDSNPKRSRSERVLFAPRFVEEKPRSG